MRQQLFRQEAIDARQVTLVGPVLRARRLSLRAITAASTAFALALVGLGMWGEYTPKVHVSGYLAPAAGLIKVYAGQAGTLAVKKVREGQQVRKGDVLYLLSTERGSVNTAEFKAAATAAIRRRLQSLALENEAAHGVAQMQVEGARSRLQGLRQELETELHAEAAITAPADGVATAVLGEAGQSTQVQTLLLVILPTGSVLQAKLLVPPRAIGFLMAGDRVSLRYQAFPHERFGSFRGRVIEIPRSTITAAEAESPVATPEPVYRISVSLDDQRISTGRALIDLQSGMLLDADVWLERHRLIEWLFEPLVRVANRA